MELIISYWKTTSHIIATAKVNISGKERWLDYDPNNPSNSHEFIRSAQIAGELTGAGVTPVDYPEPSLEELKALKLNEIEARTRLLQSEGYTVSLNGTDYVFDTYGERADNNWLWLGIQAILALVQSGPFSQDICDKNDNTITLTSAIEAITFLNTLKTQEFTMLGIGSSLRKQVNEATTKEELEAIIDPR